MKQKKVKTRLRLKGDWADHLRNSSKLSFRIKVRNNEKVFGMSKFSIQNPSTRNNHHAPLLLNMMRRAGVLAPRYFFVDVRINDKTIGVMSLEEHFEKEMVESQSRREGPIVAIDENWIWQQRHLNHNRSQIDFRKLGLHPNQVHYRFRDYPVKAFRSGKFKPGTIKSQHTIRAMSLFRDYIDGRLTGDQAYDIDLVSRWWILTNIWNGHHGAIGHNRRFYFNPVTGYLEPISFDNDAHPKGYREVVSDFAVNSLIKNPRFRFSTRKNLKLFVNMLVSDNFQNLFRSEQKKYLEILALDGLSVEAVELADLKINMATFLREVDRLFSVKRNKNKQQKLATSAKRQDPVSNSKLLQIETPLYTHLRAFWFWYPNRTVIEIKSLTHQPVIIDSVYFLSHPGINLLTNQTTIPVYEKNQFRHIIEANFDIAGFDPSDQMFVRYSYRGHLYTKPVYLQFRGYQSRFSIKTADAAWYNEKGIIVNERNKTLILKPGKYMIEQDIQIERDWLTVFLPKVEIILKHGAIFKLNGPLYSLGRKDGPVKLSVHSDLKKDLLGRWGGLFVSQSERKSHLSYTWVNGTPSIGPATRQDSFGLTGCVTFFESAVDVDNSVFNRLQCEDALNIIKSDFTLDYVTFENSNSDALDSDFSKGTVKRSEFSNSGNDGIDVSGSDISVFTARFINIDDKAISVGENSRLDATTLVVNNTGSGVVSKDKSVARIRNAKFKNVTGTALFAYVKKQEYGASTIFCDECRFDAVESHAIAQFDCRITLNSKEVPATPFTRNQMREAGYID